MANETVSKAEFDALKAKLDRLEGAAFKTEQEKHAEGQRDQHRAKQAALRAKAREQQGADASRLKYVVGPSGAYAGGRHFKPGEIISMPNDEEMAHLPSLEWTAVGGAPKAAPVEKKGPLTASEMNKLDAERPKHGVQAPKKGGRPSDNEV